MKTLYFIFFLSILVTVNGFTQNTVLVGDTIELKLEGYKWGNIQWQFSEDKKTWNNIDGAIHENFKNKIDITSFYRAKVENQTCTYFSDITSFYAFPSPSEDKYQAKHRKWQGIPTIEKTNDGTLWAAWYSGGETEGSENYIILSNSTNDGETWAEPNLIIDPAGPTRAFDPCLWVDPDKNLWLFWAQGELPIDRIAGVWAIKREFIADENVYRWSFPRRICDGIMMNKPTVLKNGNWLLPVARWGPVYSNAPDNIPNTGSFVYQSTDKGLTFDELGYSKVPQRTCDEHMIIERKDNSLWELVRTIYGVGESTSIDGGRTWSIGEKSNLINNDSRFFIRRLESGRLLFIHHFNPNLKPGINTGRNFLTASLSDDDGLTWKYNLLFDTRGVISYPDAIEDEQGNIYIIYDHNRTTDKEILLIKISEDIIINNSSTKEFPISKKIVSKP